MRVLFLAGFTVLLTSVSARAASVIMLVKPANNAPVSGQVQIQAVATRPPVSWIGFYVDGNLLSGGPSPQYRWNSSQVTNGIHTVSAIAEDANGTVIGSSSVQVKVQGNKTAPTPTPKPPTATPVPPTPTPKPPTPTPVPPTPTPKPPTPTPSVSPTPTPTGTPTPTPVTGGSWGGLIQKWSWPIETPNLLANGSFESGLASWNVVPNNGIWTQECTNAEDGSCALQVTNGSSVSGSEYACQPVTTAPQGAWYSLTGYLEGVSGGGRLQVGAGSCTNRVTGASTNIVGGTSWSPAVNAMAHLGPGSYYLAAFSFAAANGTLLFDNLLMQQLENPTAEMFLLYPNYMGRLWDDGPQTLRADVRGTGAATMMLTDAANTVLASSPIITLTSSWQTVSINVSGLSLPEGTYTLSLNDPGSNFVPQYQIVKEPRLANGYIDEDEYLHLPDANGQLTKRFAIGVYDTGSRYGTQAAWSTYLAKFFPAVQADLYLNYFQDGSAQANIEGMGQALRALGMAGLDTINDKFTPAAWNGIPNSSYLVPRATNDNGQPGLFAWYLVDELDDEFSLGRGNPIQGSWGIRTTVRPNAPDMPALIVQNSPAELEPWLDVTDIIGTDPYPLSANAPISMVSDSTTEAVLQGHGARPVWTVVQYWGNANGTGWPTRVQLRQETWQAICAGAQGVFYWSLGARGWQYLSAALQPAELADLEVVIDEVKSYEAQLTSTPVVPFPVPLPVGVIGIARRVGPTTYLFTCNTTSAVVSDSAGHTWQPYDTQFWSF
jgi:hypothetical protein